MKIAYLLHWNEGAESGVFKKVESQIAAWRRLRHDVSLFVYTNRPSDDWNRLSSYAEIHVAVYDSMLSRFTAISTMCKLAAAWRPDVIYHRFELYYPPLAKLMKSIPAFLEINTNDLTEMRSQGKLRYMYHALTRRQLIHAAAGLVFVSRELSSLAQFRRHNQNCTVIGNGFDMSGVLQSDPPHNRSVRLVFIGSPGQPWQGVDKIVKLAALQSAWHFDVIGFDKESFGGELPDNVRFHGKLKHSQYEPILRQADLAIGTLALHRKHMDEASPLKVREYLAYGLPVITGYSETDFPNEAPFILRLPNVHDNIEAQLPRIRQFAEAWAGRRVERWEVSHLDTMHKEALRIAFMMDAVGKKEAGSYEH